jgi:hypothetical protein
VPGWQAFRRLDVDAVRSQAAVLLLLRSRLVGDAEALRARTRARTGYRRFDAIPRRDAAVFPVPPVRYTGRRVPTGEVERRLTRRYGRRRLGQARAEEPAPVPMTVLADLAARLYRRPTEDNAVDLMEACLRHPQELTRVAAAAAYFPLSAEPRRLLRVLEAAVASPDALARTLAATALGRVDPRNPHLARLTVPRGPAGRGRRAHTSLLVHGTWARGSSWWQPGGDFHEYLRAEVRPDLYHASDRFEWSGQYSDAARDIAAQELQAWVEDHTASGLDLFTHSHGGSVAMLASQRGLPIGTLVLLSCPVHPDKYVPDFSHVGRAVSIRVHLDLVILIDGGGQRFPDPRIEEHVLPVWFDHFATHDPEVWRQHDVPAWL